MKLPLRLTIATAFGLFAALTISIIAERNFFSSREAILKMAKSNIAASAKFAEQGVDRLISRALLGADTIADLPGDIFDWRKPESLLLTLAVSLRASPEIYGVFVGFPDGAFVQALNLIGPDGKRRVVAGIPATAATAWRVIGPALEGRGRAASWWYFDRSGKKILDHSNKDQQLTTYDPRTRSWFKKSQESRKPTVSKAYVFASLKQPGVTISQPLNHRPDISVGVDLSLRDLARLTAQLSPGKDGVVAILDHEGDVVAYPAPEKIIKRGLNTDTIELVAASEIEDPRVRAALLGFQSTHHTHRSFRVNDEEFIAFFRPAAEDSSANWDIVSVAAVSDFTGELMATLQRSLLIAAAVLIFAIIGVAVMAGWVSQPVIRLRRMSEQITKLDSSLNEEFDSPFEEINQLQISMYQMKNALETFLQFVPRDVVRELMQSGQAATIGGTKQEVTLLFTDIEDFTTMTERMTPEEIMSQTSDYFEKLSFGIQANRGTIDKFIGDAIMAMWNAPSLDAQHADNACRGALAACRISEDLNAGFAAKGQSVMRTRFGLHTGDVLVGNVGARDRMQYTCLGSNVNLAARIEGLNKFYGTQILASDAVRRRASTVFLFRRVDIVEAKGTSVPVTIYELMGERGEDAAFYVGPETIRQATKYEQAFDFYLHRDFGDALEILKELDTEQPDDPVVALLSRKCKQFLLKPPPPNWNGATALDEK
jgi:adenylate cyclase